MITVVVSGGLLAGVHCGRGRPWHDLGRGLSQGCTMGGGNGAEGTAGDGGEEGSSPTCPPPSPVEEFGLSPFGDQEQQGVVCFISRVIVGAARGWAEEVGDHRKEWAVAVTVVRQRRRLARVGCTPPQAGSYSWEEQAVVLECETTSTTQLDSFI